MSLAEIVDDTRTDKNTVHTYLPLYDELLLSRKETAKNVLEVGIHQGGSIKMWHDYFTNAVVCGLDTMTLIDVWPELRNKERIVLHTSTDAYNVDLFRANFLDKNIRFDMVLDDGPHSLESMVQFIQLYSQILADDGILIIEDVQSWDWIDTLKNVVPEHLKPFVKTFDLRANINRYDDIVFVIDKKAVVVENM